MVWGALIGAGASLLGGALGRKSAQKQNAQNIALQREFAQHGIRWKVRDAKEAGIHPLYALGAQTHSFTPVSAGDPLGAAIADAGQGIGRAVSARQTHNERNTAFVRASQGLQLENMELQNVRLASEIALMRQPGQPPATPGLTDPFMVEGQGDSVVPTVEDLPLERVVPHRQLPSSEPGAVTEKGWLKTPTGYMPVYSKDAKERLEDDFLGSIAWNLRNRVLPTLHGGGSTPPAPVPEGFDKWIYHPIHQEYRPARWNGVTYVFWKRRGRR